MRQQVFFVALLAVLAVALAQSDKVRFDGHRLARISIKTEQQRQYVEALGLDVWSHESNVVIGDNEVVLPPGMEQTLQVEIAEYLIGDIQAVIDQQEAERMDSAKAPSFFSDYHAFEDIVYEAKRIADSKSDIVTFIPSIGQTIQGRDIVAMVLQGGPAGKLAKSTGKLDPSVPKVLFIGGQHAREWINMATVMYIYNELVTLYGTDPVVTAWLNKVAVVIVPVVNPDGYDYSWTGNRLWRKNRRANKGGSYGVDLNRNWDTQWGTVGTSKTPTSDTYCGTGPFSEPETKSVSDFIKGLGNVVSGIDWHSYSQLILRPSGWTTTPPPNDKFLTALGNSMKSAIKKVHNQDYVNEGSWELYFTSGSASDWFYDKANILISYTIELRDTGRYGFLLPASQIVPTGQESWAAAKVFFNATINSINTKH